MRGTRGFSTSLRDIFARKQRDLKHDHGPCGLRDFLVSPGSTKAVTTHNPLILLDLPLRTSTQPDLGLLFDTSEYTDGLLIKSRLHPLGVPVANRQRPIPQTKSCTPLLSSINTYILSAGCRRRQVANASLEKIASFGTRNESTPLGCGSTSFLFFTIPNTPRFKSTHAPWPVV